MWKTLNGHRDPIRSSYLYRKGFGHQSLMIGRSLGQREATRRASMSLRAARGAQDRIFRAQSELWIPQNLTRICPKELWASDLEVLEAPGTPRGDQESLKEVCKSSKVTIHGVYRVIMSRQGAAGSPQRGPKEPLESQNEVQSNPEQLHRGFEELRKRA